MLSATIAASSRTPISSDDLRLRRKCTPTKKRPGAAVTRQWLVENVLDPEREGSERTLDVHVSRLRRKLGPGKHVETVWGIAKGNATSSRETLDRVCSGE